MEDIPAQLLNEASPHADIHLLFQHYNSVYFDSMLGAARVEWSSARMTSCAGTCARTEWGDCVIRLSKPILVLRPEEDLKNTLLHEMIHAYIMLLQIPGAGKDGHGTPFKHRMALINSSDLPDIHRPPGGYKITVYHTMLDEVRHLQQHWWRCDRCGKIIRRAMNRRPQPADCLTRKGNACRHPKCSYHMHERACGGSFLKIKEPEPKPKDGKKVAPGTSAAPASQTIASAFAQVKAASQDLKLKPGMNEVSVKDSAAAMAALAGSVRRRAVASRAQPSIVQFAQMAPRKAGGPGLDIRSQPEGTADGEAVVDLTVGSDEDPCDSAGPGMPASASARQNGADAAGSDAAACKHASSAMHTGDVHRHASRGDAAAGLACKRGSIDAGAHGAQPPDWLGQKRRKAVHGEDGSAIRAHAGARQVAGVPGGHLQGEVAEPEAESSGSLGVAIVDVEGTVDVAQSGEDAGLRERRALCAAAAERRRVQGAVEAAHAAGTPDPV